MRRSAWLGILLGAVLGCHREPEGTPVEELDAHSDPNGQSSRASPYALSPVDTLGDTTSWGLPRRMELVGDYLVIVDFYATYQVIVLDARTGEARGAFGRKGGGPREIQEPDVLSLESTTPPRLWVYDSGSLRFTLWAIDRAGPLLEPMRNFRTERATGYQESFLTSHGMVFTRKYGDAVLYLADSAGKVREAIGELPYPTTEYLYDAIVNQPIPVADPDRRRLALPYLRTNRVDFYEATGRHIATGAAPVEVAPLRITRVDGKQRFERPLPVTFGRGAATSRFVYLPYCGCTTADQPPEYRLVQVFDWTGAFVMTLALGVSAWAVEADDNNERLYAAIDDPFPLIVKYRLPQALRDWGRP